MTAPGSIIPPNPGWWVRKDRIGVAEPTYGWAGVATGLRNPLATGSGTVSWAGAATGVAPIVPMWGALGSGQPGTLTTSFAFNGPNAVAGDTVIAYIAVDRPTQLSAVTYNGAGMRALGKATILSGDANSADSGSFYAFATQITSGNAGIKSIAGSLGPGAAWMDAQAVSYKNVSAIGFPLTTQGVGSSVSQAVTCPLFTMISQAFVAFSATGSGTMSFTSLSGGTNRWLNTTGAAVPGLSINDTVATTTFAANLPSSNQWAALAFPLLPTSVPPGIVPGNVGVGQPATNSSSVSFNHEVIIAGADVFVDIVVDRTCTITAGPTCAGAAMTLVGTTTWPGADAGATIRRYRITGQSAGVKSISATLSTTPWVCASSISMLGVSSVGSGISASNASSQPSHAVTCSAGQVILDTIASTAEFLPPLSGGVGMYDFPQATLNIMTRVANANATFQVPNTGVGWGSLANVLS